jgi:hypothetical protein
VTAAGRRIHNADVTVIIAMFTAVVLVGIVGLCIILEASG